MLSYGSEIIYGLLINKILGFNPKHYFWDPLLHPKLSYFGRLKEGFSKVVLGFSNIAQDFGEVGDMFEIGVAPT